MSMRRPTELVAALAFAGSAAFAGPPTLIITGIGDDLAATGNGVAGLVSIDLTSPYADFSTVPITWARGVGYTIIPGAQMRGSSGVSCSSDLGALAMCAENLSDWGMLNCFNGYDWMGEPNPANPEPCDPIGISHRWTSSTGWVNLGSFQRTVDPETGRLVGGTHCGEINEPKDISADGRYVLANGWFTGAFSSWGGPASGLCGGFFPFRYDSLTDTLEPLELRPESTTSRADYINADGRTITGYDVANIELAGPVSVVVADLNADGVNDLVVSNRDLGNASVLLGNADGTFQDAVAYWADWFSVSGATVAEFTGDSVPDLVLIGSAGASVLAGLGDGSFQSLGQFPGEAGVGPRAVAAGDMNNDGFTDVVIANFDDGTVSVLLGNGDGTFQSAVSSSVGTGPTAVALGHLNAGGALDVVVANSGSDSVSVLLGNGDGTLQTALSLSVGASPSGVAIGALNGDGNADLVVSNQGSGNVSVLLGNGDGTFGAAANFAAGNGPSGVAIGAFNGDAFADVAVSNFDGGGVSVLLGNGNGTLQSAVAIGTGINPSAVAAGVFGNGATTDLAVANFGSASVSILPGTGDGTFGTGEVYSTSGGFFNSVRQTVVWRDGEMTVLDAYAGAKDNAAISGPGTQVASGASAGFVAATFPGESGSRLVRWTLTDGEWTPENLGRPADLVIDPDTNETMPFTTLWATGMSNDGGTIVGVVQYGDPPPFGFGVRRPFIWRASINGGVPMDFEAYIASVDAPGTPTLPEGFTIYDVKGIGGDGNAVLVSILDRRNTCASPSLSHVAFNGGIMYLDGAGIACEPPRIGVGPEDWTDDTGTIFGVSLNVLASGTWPMTYQWQREDTENPGMWQSLTESCMNFTTEEDWAYEGVNKNQLRIGVGTEWASRAGRYRVVISNSCGTVTSDPVTVAFNPGACCLSGGVCVLDFSLRCTPWGNGGMFLGSGTTCMPESCAERACCFDTLCVVTDPGSCIASFGIVGEPGSTCSPDPCGSSVGACCFGTSCVVTGEFDCAGTFLGLGTACEGEPGNTITCCPANFNQEGGVSVQDIYDFLTDWNSQVGGGPVILFSADFNDSGDVTVQDIYDFLSAWNTGCTE